MTSLVDILKGFARAVLSGAVTEDNTLIKVDELLKTIDETSRPKKGDKIAAQFLLASIIEQGSGLVPDKFVVSWMRFALQVNVDPLSEEVVNIINSGGTAVADKRIKVMRWVAAHLGDANVKKNFWYMALVVWGHTLTWNELRGAPTKATELRRSKPAVLPYPIPDPFLSLAAVLSSLTYDLPALEDEPNQTETATRWDELGQQMRVGGDPEEARRQKLLREYAPSQGSFSRAVNEARVYLNSV